MSLDEYQRPRVAQLDDERTIRWRTVDFHLRMLTKLAEQLEGLGSGNADTDRIAYAQLQILHTLTNKTP